MAEISTANLSVYLLCVTQFLGVRFSGCPQPRTTNNNSKVSNFLNESVLFFPVIQLHFYLIQVYLLLDPAHASNDLFVLFNISKQVV